MSAVQGPEEAKQLEERFQTVASEEGHAVSVTCVASQAFAVLPVDGAPLCPGRLPAAALTTALLDSTIALMAMQVLCATLAVLSRTT